MKRLGMAYHFQEQIQQALNQLNSYLKLISDDLSTVALHFRLLREDCFPITVGGDGRFMGSLCGDVEGLLRLNEASFMAIQGEKKSLKKLRLSAWDILCRAHITEARWFYGGQIPTFDEYIKNAWISIGSLGGLVLVCFVEADSIVHQFPNCLKDSQLFYRSSLITRLSNDLGTSKAEMERKDILKAVQSYTIEKGISEEKARNHVKELISNSWKKINEEILDSRFSRVIVNLSKNMARTAQCIYQHGDGVGTSTGVTKDCIVSSILRPIPI
ncbi:hypothetical protein Godav_009762 [Gossypium davidsonii]|uniref:Terpene synthase metal-binding domain-containing protein n=1 Tax=Gossypium davidsonii TaxID=34287 RepID=A0A7J8SET9_GOSDV|nr:hypothetical protein [Gossypium davidsonii]